MNLPSWILVTEIKSNTQIKNFIHLFSTIILSTSHLFTIASLPGWFYSDIISSSWNSCYKKNLWDLHNYSCLFSVTGFLSNIRGQNMNTSQSDAMDLLLVESAANQMPWICCCWSQQPIRCHGFVVGGVSSQSDVMDFLVVESAQNDAYMLQ